MTGLPNDLMTVLPNDLMTGLPNDLMTGLPNALMTGPNEEVAPNDSFENRSSSVSNFKQRKGCFFQTENSTLLSAIILVLRSGKTVCSSGLSLLILN
ncbi:hypothetical protein AVEN_204855-1 [Araneus ventricosus]|uniref:Uncharacterized protein n=1 Tax=Araneus ventricosus TaxID=182803 RepID=A0A4Y2DXJ3_ARAVE|nr:hypothetical protein AVEN_204855-1 [Araneus ventricosus]